MQKDQNIPEATSLVYHLFFSIISRIDYYLRQYGRRNEHLVEQGC